MKFIKSTIFIFCTIFMGFLIWFVPELSDATSVFYVLLIGTFLTIDILGMIKKTSMLPNGCYDKMNTYRYIVVACCLLCLLALSFYIYQKEPNIKLTIVSFSSAVFIVAGLVIAGIDGNKMVTIKEEECVLQDKIECQENDIDTQ